MRAGQRATHGEGKGALSQAGERMVFEAAEGGLRVKQQQLLPRNHRPLGFSVTRGIRQIYQWHSERESEHLYVIF
jgi:hypothetical protein